MKRIRFQRHGRNPVISRDPGTFRSRHTANPDLLFFYGRYHLYFRGQGEEGRDQIGVAYADPKEFDGIHWEMCPENPVIRVSESDFDSGYILDPAAIARQGRVHLYYSAHSRDWKNWNIPSHIGLATSGDGTCFEKSPHNPIIIGTAPEVVQHDGRLHLFFQRRTEEGCFEVYCCPSDDGIRFPEGEQRPVFGPSKIDGAFDRYSVSTVRIWQEGAWFYMFYGGCDRYFDYPRAIGLARSKDLLLWERYPHNPILDRGEPGEWDEGALWFATVHKRKDTYYLWYEGTGCGLGLSSPEAREASRQCREEDYGGYAKTSFSQIGLALYHGDIHAW